MTSNVRSIIVSECQNETRFLDLDKHSDNLDIHIGKGAVLWLRLINLSLAHDIKINVDVEDDGELSAVMADFSSGVARIDVTINLKGKNAKGVWKLSALSSHDDNKRYVVGINHQASNTYGLMDNYGVARNMSQLTFSGANGIIRGAKQSKTRQNAKIIVFDEGAIAKADPRLNIDENEVEASHAAVVGKLSDEHLFYLMSRGLNLNEAKRLITLGYLLPITEYFDPSTKSRIAKMIEERV